MRVMTARLAKWTLLLAVSVGSLAFALTEEEVREGDRLLQAGEFQRAEALYRAAVEKDSNDAEARLRLLKVLVIEGRNADAATHLEHLVRQGYGQEVLSWARDGEGSKTVIV